jgi:hypothetical protein
VETAVGTLGNRGDELYITTQNIAEFWNVATRPIANNGLEPAAGHGRQIVRGYNRAHLCGVGGTRHVTGCVQAIVDQVQRGWQTSA